MSIDLNLNDRDVLAAMELRRNGLITIDKFCMSRWCRLPLSWSRQPRRLRCATDGNTQTPSSRT